MTIIEGFYVDPSGRKKYGQIRFDDGKILSVTSDRGNADIVYPKTCLIFPGFVDPHVHAREDRTQKWSYKEDFTSAGEAAINGGITAWMEMPNTPEPIVNEEQYLARKRLAKKAQVPIVICAGISPTSEPIPGVENYKAYLTKSVGDLYFTSPQGFREQLRKYARFQLHVHCEDHNIIEHDATRPANAEINAVRDTIHDAISLKARVHLCHISTAQAADMAISARKHGITFEVTPHHLFFDTTNRGSFARGQLIKMNPPLRSEDDRKRLLRLFRDGEVDCLATDHAPHTLEEKQESNPSGVPLLDTYGPFVAWLIVTQKVPLKFIVKACSENPARLIGLNQGQIKRGQDASFTILNIKRPIKIEQKMLRTKCKWSPFEGFTFPGRVEATIVRGMVVSHDTGARKR